MKIFCLTSASLTCALGLAVTGVSAHTGNGHVLIGGTVSFYSDKQEDADDATTTLDISPNFGYFVADQTALGASVSIGSISQGGNSLTTLGIGPIPRFYFVEPLFGQIGYNFQSIDYGDFGSTSGGILTLSLGGGFFLNDNVAIEPQIYCGFGSFKPDGGDSYGFSDVGFLPGVQALIGGGE